MRVGGGGLVVWGSERWEGVRGGGVIIGGFGGTDLLWKLRNVRIKKFLSYWSRNWVRFKNEFFFVPWNILTLFSICRGWVIASVLIFKRIFSIEYFSFIIRWQPMKSMSNFYKHLIELLPGLDYRNWCIYWSQYLAIYLRYSL